MYDKIMEIEDYLQEYGVFVNPITGRRAHQDSYMTCVEYAKLNEALNDNHFSADEWAAAVGYWLTNENMQPPLKLVAREVQRYCRKLAGLDRIS